MIEFDSRKLSPATTILFEYVCGLIWLVDIGLLASLTRRADELVAFLVRGAEALSELAMPEVVVTYAAAIVGVVLPYATAMVFKPLSVLISNRVLPFIREHYAADQVTEAHRQLVKEQVRKDLGMELPDWWAYFLELYIEQKESRTLDSVRASYNRGQGLMQSALPVAIFIGVVIALIGGGVWSIVLGISVAMIAFFVLLKSAIDAHLRWDNGVIFSYLIQSDDRPKGRVEPEEKEARRRSERDRPRPRRQRCDPWACCDGWQ